MVAVDPLPVPGDITVTFKEPHGPKFFDFGAALVYLRKGSRVGRNGWNGRGLWIALQVPTPQSKMTLPYIYMSTAQHDFVPWLASPTDLLALDWVFVD